MIIIIVFFENIFFLIRYLTLGFHIDISSSNPVNKHVNERQWFRKDGI